LFPASIQAYDWNNERWWIIVLKVSREENNTHIGLHTATFMEKALTLYESRWFERLPELDLEPMNDGIIVKAFIMDLNKTS
jgi:hypothetical protein